MTTKPGELSKAERLRQAAPQLLKFAEDFCKWCSFGKGKVPPPKLIITAFQVVKEAGGKLLPKEKP